MRSNTNHEQALCVAGSGTKVGSEELTSLKITGTARALGKPRLKALRTPWRCENITRCLHAQRPRKALRRGTSHASSARPCLTAGAAHRPNPRRQYNGLRTFYPICRRQNRLCSRRAQWRVDLLPKPLSRPVQQRIHHLSTGSSRSARLQHSTGDSRCAKASAQDWLTTALAAHVSALAAVPWGLKAQGWRVTPSSRRRCWPSRQRRGS